MARYGRTEKFDSMADEAIQTAMRVTKQQQSAHSLIKEWTPELRRATWSICRKKVWS